ncbi:hypothetical protein I2I05_11500 [Hymenobacter sp. BT683]|uniref:Linalool dehydratase/isomerase domain-containing protein n=1 Tax=Hymenobacter jeongseonensis TaxID=2791027 RepID=A0ABS0II29_9BACT|nr:hypothetical protein [Hymenobacter jeongseonensis]MBF9238019.1 hypothetical protein [Hymenobacter jeongseonensis]
MRRRTVLILLVLLAVFLGWLSQAKYHHSPPAALRKKAHYLEQISNGTSAGAQDLTKLRELNPEWALFSLSFSVYALTNMAERDPNFRAEAALYIETAIQKALSSEISAFSRTAASPVARLDTAGSVLYLGHLNLMLGCHRLLNPTSRYTGLHDTLSRVLHGRYQRTPSHCLPSYPGLTWVPDNTVALASLSLHSQLTGSPYRQYCAQWVAYARQHLTDSKTGLLVSRPSTPQHGAEEPRGSMLSWSICFLYRFAPIFAAEQYCLYQNDFSTNLGVVQLYKEWPGSFATTSGDVDSGPLILGYGIPATAFAFGNAVALRDWRNAQRLRRVISIGSREIEMTDELKYGVRLVDLPVSPLAEALLLHAETMTPWR